MQDKMNYNLPVKLKLWQVCKDSKDSFMCVVIRLCNTPGKVDCNVWFCPAEVSSAFIYFSQAYITEAARGQHTPTSPLTQWSGWLE